MPTVRTRKTDFTAGEWSPTLEGRVDLDRAARSCKRLESFLLLPHGAAQRRPGSRMVAQANGSGLALMVRFEVSRTDAYMLEFTAGKVRFYRNGGRVESPPGTPVEITTTYLEGELRDLDFHQANDVLFLAHELHPLARLERLSNIFWRLRDVIFDVAPSIEFGSRPNATCTPSAVSGTGKTITASANAFEASDVGRFVEIFSGANIGARAKITAVATQLSVTVDIIEVFTDLTANPIGSWRISDSPFTKCTPSVKSPVGTAITLTLTAAGWRNNGADTDVGKFVHLLGGTVEITGFTNSTVVTGILRAELTTVTAAESGTWTLDEPAFSVKNGYVAHLTFFGDRFLLGRTTARPVNIWGSKPGDYFNFSLGVLADDGIAFALNTDQLDAIEWLLGTKVLVIGTAGGEFVMDPGEGQELRPDNLPLKSATTYGSHGSLRPARVGNIILFATRSRRKIRELTFSFEVDNYVAPDLLLLAEHMTRPVRLRGVRTTRALLQMAYQREPNSIVWAVREDGTLLGMTYLRDQNVVGWHRHISGPGQPDLDGLLIPLLDDGQVESVAVMPNPQGDGEQVWLSVRRTVSGTVRHYIEYLDDTGHFYEQLNTDSTLTADGTVFTATVTPSATVGVGVTFAASAPVFAAGDVGKEIRVLGTRYRAVITAFTDTTHVLATIAAAYEFPSLAPIAAGAWGLAAFTFSGLAHLEGKEVQLVGDGATYAPLTVSGGAIGPVPYACVKAEVGLNYVSTLVIERPEVVALGTIQGLKQRFARVWIRLYKSLGLTIQGKALPFRTTADPMGAPPDLFTGDKELENLGDGTSESRITVQQTQPLPCTVLMFVGRLNTEDE